MLETCCSLMVEAYHKSLMTSRDGNVSVRYEKDNHFWITPTNVRKHTLQPDQFKKLSVELDQDGQIVELPYTTISSNLRPSGEYPAHYHLQKRLPSGCEQRVVMHVHSTYTLAALERKISLENFHLKFPEISRYTRVAPSIPRIPAVSQELGDAVASHLGLKDDGSTLYDIVAIEGHGVFSVDKTPWRAFEHIERVEHVSKILVLAN